MARLIITKRGTDENWTHDCMEDVISIGRLDRNIVQLRATGVSRQHAEIRHGDDLLFFIDLGSGNGSYLNGMRLEPQEKNLLQHGDIISIDAFDLRLQTETLAELATPDEEVTESDILEVKLLKKVLTAFDKEMVPSLEVLNGSAEGKRIALTDGITEIVIGRDPDCDFPINEYVTSRRHAKVIKRWGGISIRDLESKNGTFLNNRRVVEEYLHDGDRIALGTIVLMFRNPQEINVAALEPARPKYAPAPVTPQEIEGLAGEGEAFDEEEYAEDEGEAPSLEEDAQEEEANALEEWDELEKSISRQEPYPEPRAKASILGRMTPVEIGMIGLGALVIIFAVITIVNLLMA